GTLGGKFTSSTAVAINEHGEVIGDVSSSAAGKAHAFLWRQGRMVDLGTLGGKFTSSDAVAINGSGQVIGNAYAGYPGLGPSRAFLWSNGRLRDLGDLGGGSSEATGINAGGDVIGTSDTSQTDANGYPVPHTFLWSQGTMRDLGARQFVFDSRGRPVEVCGGRGCGVALAFNHRGQGAGYCIVWSKRRGDQIARP